MNEKIHNRKMDIDRMCMSYKKQMSIYKPWAFQNILPLISLLKAGEWPYPNMGNRIRGSDRDHHPNWSNVGPSPKRENIERPSPGIVGTIININSRYYYNYRYKYKHIVIRLYCR